MWVTSLHILALEFGNRLGAVGFGQIVLHSGQKQFVVSHPQQDVGYVTDGVVCAAIDFSVRSHNRWIGNDVEK